MTWLLAFGLPALALALFWFAPRCLDAWLDDALTEYRARERDEFMHRASLPPVVRRPFDQEREAV